MNSIVDLFLSHQWVALGAVVIGLLVRLMKTERAEAVLRIPAQWRPWLAIVLGVVQGVLEAIVAGKPPKRAILEGLVAAALAIVGHDLLIEGLRGGRELGEPKPKGGTA